MKYYKIFKSPCLSTIFMSSIQATILFDLLCCCITVIKAESRQLPTTNNQERATAVNCNNSLIDFLKHFNYIGRHGEFCEIKSTMAASSTAIKLQPQHYVTTLANVSMPKIIYGTAWKKDDTARLVVTAIRTGFRGIDTACQPKHYNESGVGLALKTLIDAKEIRREDIFLQTKFTSVDGQDPHRIPYDPNASLPEQVRQSLQVSLKNLNTTYIDSIVLHSPMRAFKDTITVWRVFEQFIQAGHVKQLGISNCYDIRLLKKLWDEAVIKPSVIQNRLYQDTDFDKTIRQFANQHNIYYQSFWTLTANPGIIKSTVVRDIAKRYSKTAEQIFFAYLMNSAKNMVPLTGTSNEEHMRQDLEALTSIKLAAAEAAVFDAVINGESSS